MAGQRKSTTAEQAELNIANLQSIDPNLDLGDGLSIAALTELTQEVRQAVKELNTADLVISNNRKVIREKEKETLELLDRIHFAVAAKYGKNSKEYKAATKASKRGKKSKNDNNNDDGGNGNNPPANPAA
jgi:predicted nucleic acid-binding protein